MKAFTQVATTLFGLLSGGMILIAFGLVPYWRSVDTGEFTTAFSASLPTVGGTMIVLTMLATLSVVIAAGHAFWKKSEARTLLIAAAVAALVMLITVPIYFGAANPLLAGGTLSSPEISAELAMWQKMHMFRTIVGVIGLFCAVRAGYAQSAITR